jgi:hypothetical protein
LYVFFVMYGSLNSCKVEEWISMVVSFKKNSNLDYLSALLDFGKKKGGLMAVTV